MKGIHHILLILGGLYVLFVAYDSWKAYQSADATASRWNILARVINWRVQAAASPTNQPLGSGVDWSYAQDYVKGGAV